MSIPIFTVCSRVGNAVDIYLLVDCDFDPNIQSAIRDAAYYIASNLYPHSFSNGVRLWVVSVQSSPQLLLDGRSFQSTNE